MIGTTKEQSKHLLELGLDPKTADCNWNTTFGDWSLCIGKNKLPHAVPAWSLSALLEMMPSFIDYKGQKLRLTIEKAGIWNVFYLGTEHRLNEIWFNGEYGDPVEPAYRMVCWLLEQGFIKKGGEV
jgi:hypothetical protein